MKGLSHLKKFIQIKMKMILFNNNISFNFEKEQEVINKDEFDKENQMANEFYKSLMLRQMKMPTTSR